MISTNPFQPDRVQLPANKERTQGPLTVLLCKLPDAIRQQIEVVESGCWLWTGTQFTTGYGLICQDGKLWKAHRYIWTLINGPIPPRIQCLHHCDTPACVNALDTEHTFKEPVGPGNSRKPPQSILLRKEGVA